MLPLSNITITLSRSNDYLRYSLLLHLLTLIVLVRAGLPFALKVLLGCLLIFFFLKSIRSKLPSPNYQKLTSHPGYWLLHDKTGCQIRYEQASISFEGGLFILLKLTGISPAKTIVIFNDQITIAQYRLLKFINVSKKQM